MIKTIDKTVSKEVENIIENAKRYLNRSNDDKCYLHPEEFLLVLQYALTEGIGPEKDIVRLNRVQADEGYVHDITYKGINFITATPKRIKVDYE